MKYLSHYVEQAQTECFDKHGAFFAFSNKQFAEKQKQGVEYVSLGMGLICPKPNAKLLIEELNAINAKGILQDVEENGMEAIIKRELYNHECFYTGDISDCVDTLKDYPTNEGEIRKVYNKEYPNVDL